MECIESPSYLDSVRAEVFTVGDIMCTSMVLGMA